MSTPLNSLDFIDCSDLRLAQQSLEIPKEEIKSRKIQDLIDQMLKLSGDEASPSDLKQSRRLVGLAAPQVGILKRIIIVDASQQESDPQFHVLINPKIIWTSSKKEAIPQGCYSVPDHLVGIPERHTEVEVVAFNQHGQQVIRKYMGFASHVVQHEIDHLDGVRFPERLKSFSELHIVEKKDIAKYRNHWKNWSKCASSDTLLRLQKKDYSMFQ